MITQLEFGEFWEACDYIVCSCAAHGPVLVLDRKIAEGLTHRTSRCKGCGAVLTWRMTAPPTVTKPARPAPLINMIEG